MIAEGTGELEGPSSLGLPELFAWKHYVPLLDSRSSLTLLTARNLHRQLASQLTKNEEYRYVTQCATTCAVLQKVQPQVQHYLHCYSQLALENILRCIYLLRKKRLNSKVQYTCTVKYLPALEVNMQLQLSPSGCVGQYSSEIQPVGLTVGKLHTLILHYISPGYRSTQQLVHVIPVYLGWEEVSSRCQATWSSQYASYCMLLSVDVSKARHHVPMATGLPHHTSRRITLWTA